MLGKRGTFGSVFTELAPAFDNTIAISADFVRSSGLERFSKLYPDKCLNVGIAEQNLVGVASGLASEGYNVFATSFASFITTRSYEQVKIHCGYMHHNIKIIGLAAGFGVQQQGNTHYGLDDICLMRSIPNLTILSPADSTEVAKSVEALLEYEGPAYLRLCGEAGDPMVYKGDYEFKIGKAIKLNEGADLVIFATGTMVYQALQVSKLFSEIGVSCAVVNINTIRPLDVETVISASVGKKLIVTMEEGFVTGGMGSAILQVFARYNIIKPVEIIGLEDFIHPGSYKFMQKQTGLDAESLFNRIQNKLNAL